MATDIIVKARVGVTGQTTVSVPVYAVQGDTLCFLYAGNVSVAGDTGWDGMNTRPSNGVNLGFTYKTYAASDPTGTISLNGADTASHISLFTLSGVNRDNYSGGSRIRQLIPGTESSSGNTVTEALAERDAYPILITFIWGTQDTKRGYGIEFLMLSTGSRTLGMSGYFHDVTSATIDSVSTVNAFETLWAGDGGTGFEAHLAWRDVGGTTVDDTIQGWTVEATCTAVSRTSGGAISTTEGFQPLFYSGVMLYQNYDIPTPQPTVFKGYGNGVALLNCRALANGGSGIIVSRAGASLKACEAAGNTGDGIYLAGGDGVAVTGNSAHDNGGRGIHLTNADSNIVAGNMVENNTGDGIDVVSGEANLVTRNRVRTGHPIGINVESEATDNFVVANDLKNAGTTAFTDAGTDTTTANGNLTT